MPGVSETLDVLRCCFDARVVPALWGEHGIGKTDIVKKATEEWLNKKATQSNFKPINLSNYPDTGDLLGLPVISSIGTGKKTEYAVPHFLPTVSSSTFEEAGVIFLDEFNRCNLQVMQTMYPFILEGRIHDYYLPDGWRIIIACNPSGGDYYVNDFDPALYSRFCHLNFTPTKKEWLAWAKESGKIDESIISFAKKIKNAIPDNFEETAELIKPTIDRRSHELLTRCIRSTETIFANNEKKILNVIANISEGFYGKEASHAFMNFYSKKEKLNSYNPELILSDYEEFKKNNPDIFNNIEQNTTLLDEIAMDVIGFLTDQSLKNSDIKFSDLSEKNISIKPYHLKGLEYLNIAYFKLEEILVDVTTFKDFQISNIDGELISNTVLDNTILFLYDLPDEIFLRCIKKLNDGSEVVKKSQHVLNYIKMNRYIQSNLYLANKIKDISWN